MSDLTQKSQFYELFRVILPIITFGLGFLLSQYDRYRQERMQRKNLSRILRKEILENFRTINKVIPHKDESLAPDLLTVLEGNISFRVFDAYIAKLDSLEKPIPDRVYDCYRSLENLVQSCRNYTTIIESEGKESRKFVGVSVAIMMAAKLSHQNCELALAALPGGSVLASELRGERGAIASQYERIESLKGNMRKKDEP